MAKKTTKKDPYARERQIATDSADVRFGQEIDGLRLLQDAAAGTYNSGRSQANSAAQSIIAAASQAEPGLKDLLKRTGTYSGATTARIAPPPGSGLAGEAGVVANNMGLTAQSAIAGLANEKVRAAQAGAYQGQRARDEYRSDTAKIADRAQSLNSEYGAFAQKTLGDLLESKADRQVEYEKMRRSTTNAANSQLTQLLSAGLNPDGTVREGGPKDPAVIQAGRPAPAPPKPVAPPKPAPGTPGAASQSDVTTFSRNLAAANTGVGIVANELNKGAIDSDAAIALLTDGGKHPGTGRVIKGTGDAVSARAALEVRLHGGISPQTVEALHRMGIKVSSLGFRTIPRRQIQANVEARARRIKRP